MTSKTTFNCVAATRFNSSDYEKIKDIAAIKRLKIAELLRRLTLDYLDQEIKRLS